MGSFIKYLSEKSAYPTGIGGNIMTTIMNLANVQQYKSVINNLICEDKSKTLDVGFGNGYLLNKLLTQKTGDFYGIEISDDMIKNANNRNKKFINEGRLFLSNNDIMELSFQNDFFDNIYSVNTVYFWQNLNKRFVRN